jgi:alkylation response protein AidB-like acyl-CoA dehydrogenase
MRHLDSPATNGNTVVLNQATLNYLKTRKQFGVSIGAFQVLQHRMAEMIIAAERTRSMAIITAAQVGDDDVAKRRRAISGAGNRCTTRISNADDIHVYTAETDSNARAK